MGRCSGLVFGMDLPMKAGMGMLLPQELIINSALKKTGFILLDLMFYMTYNSENIIVFDY